MHRPSKTKSLLLDRAMPLLLSCFRATTDWYRPSPFVKKMFATEDGNNGGDSNDGFGSSSSSSDEGNGGNDGIDLGGGNTDSGDGGNSGEFLGPTILY